MKWVVFLALMTSGLALSACQSDPAPQKTTTLPRSGTQVGGTGSLDDKKINCVAQGGFLVPAGNGFNCKMPGGQVVSLWNL